MKKPLALLCVLALAGCAAAPPQSFAPLDYSYLRPINFKVATLNIVNDYVPGADEAALNADNPAPPAATLLTMLNNRLQPNGQPGTGTVSVQAASITETGGTLNGRMTVDINLTNADGSATGFAEATVAASAPAPDGGPDSNQMRAALYNMTRQLMTAINVQLPYQIYHNLAGWVAWTTPRAGAALAAPGTGEAPGAIQATPLGTPGSGTSPAPAGTAPSVPPSVPLPMPDETPPLQPGQIVPNYLPGAGPAALTPPQ